MAIMKNLIASAATYVNQPKYILPDFYSNFNKIGHAITRFATVCTEDLLVVNILPPGFGKSSLVIGRENVRGKT